MLNCAHAVLLLGNFYVLQLRDQRPDIAASGQWSLFGGRLEPDETPEAAVRREVREELNIQPSCFRLLGGEVRFGEFEKTYLKLWSYEAKVDNCWDNHRLKEGRAVGVFPFEKLRELSIPVIMYQVLEQHFKSTNRVL